MKHFRTSTFIGQKYTAQFTKQTCSKDYKNKDTRCEILFYNFLPVQLLKQCKSLEEFGIFVDKLITYWHGRSPNFSSPTAFLLLIIYFLMK